MKKYICLVIALVGLLACQNSKSYNSDRSEPSVKIEDLLKAHNQKIIH
ncbi:hypothetical protein [uncultured Aquimarina sp.]|nr:hypothetical protein [uncultured Aquimarina sp.]